MKKYRIFLYYPDVGEFAILIESETHWPEDHIPIIARTMANRLGADYLYFEEATA